MLDLYCGAGGAAVGLHRAWPDAEIVGIDIKTQPRYPFKFIHGDALEIKQCGKFIFSGSDFASRESENDDQKAGTHRSFGLSFDFIWISPVCKRYTKMTNCRPGIAESHPDDIALWRERLEAQSYEVPWVIENVPGAPLRNPVMLCGLMFGLELHRHRLFEASFPIAQPPHPKHTRKASRAGHWMPGTVMSIAGNFSPVAEAKRIMGIDWMTRDELSQAIPPAYSQYIVEQFKGSHESKSR